MIITQPAPDFQELSPEKGKQITGQLCYLHYHMENKMTEEGTEEQHDFK